MSSKHSRDDPSLYSSKKTLGVLHIFSETDQILDQSIFPLKSGDNFVGSGNLCDIILPYSSIDKMLCKISLNPDNEFTIEDLDSKIGIYRTLHDQLRQKLKANKVYDLYPDKPFYIGDQYRCVFRPAPIKKSPENSGEASPLQQNDYLMPRISHRFTPSRSPSPEAQTEIPQTLPIASLEQEMDEIDRAYNKYEPSSGKPSSQKATLQAPTKPSDFVNSLFHDDYYNSPMMEEQEEQAETPVKVEGKASPFTKNFKRKNTAGLKTETRESEPEFEVSREKMEESSLRAGNEGLLEMLGKKKVEEDEDRADTVSISSDNYDEPEPEPEEPEEEERLPEEPPEENLQKEAEENSNNSASFVKHFTKKGKTALTPADELPGRRKEEKIAEIPSSFTGLEDDEATSFSLITAKKPEKTSKKKDKTPKKVSMEEEDEEEEDPLKLIRRVKPVEVRKEAKEIEDIDFEEDNKEKKKGRYAKKAGKKPEEKPKKKEIEEEKPKKVIEEEEDKPRRGQRKPVEEEKVTPIKEKKSPISKAKEQIVQEEPQRKHKQVEDVTPKKSSRGAKNKANEEIEEEEVTGRGMRSKRSTEKAKEQEEEKAVKTGRSIKQIGSPDTKTPVRVARNEKKVGSPDTKSSARDVTPVRGKKKEENEVKRGSRNEKIIAGSPDTKTSRRDVSPMRENEAKKGSRNEPKAASPDTKTPIRTARNEKKVGSPDTKTSARDVRPIREAKKGSRNEPKVTSPDTKTSRRDVSPIRGKKKEENKQEEDVKKGRVSQRLAKKSAEKDEEEEEEVPKRGRNAKKTPEKKEPEVKKSTRGKSRIEEEEEEEKPIIKRGARGKSKVQEEEEKPATKRGARGKSKVQEEEKPVPKRGARGKSKVQEQEEEETPRRKKEPEKKKKEKETKGKTAQKEEKKRGRKPAKVIEMEVEDEEEEEEEEPEPEVPKKGRQSKKAPEPEVKKTTRGKSRIEEEQEEEEPKPKEAPKRGRNAKKATEPEPKKSTRGKRSAPSKEDIYEEPIPDKKRKTSTKAAPSKNNSQDIDLQKRNAYKVLFSGFAVNDKKVANAKKNLKTIGVNISEDMDNFNVLVMSELRRTIKFLFAVSQGASVVSFDWVTDSLKEGKAVVPDDYLFEDESIESTHHFKLNPLLKKVRRGEKDLLKGIHVWLPNNIKPSYEEVKTLIEGIQGTVVKTKPGKYKEDVIILVNEGDEKQAKHFVDIGFKVHTTELIYSGILQQKLNFGQNQVKVKGSK